MQTAFKQPGSPVSDAAGNPRAKTAPLRVVHTVSSLQVGGMEQFVLRIAAAQRRQGHPVCIVTLKGGPLAAEARRLGIPVRVLSGSHKAIRFARGLVTMARLRPEIVHAHNPTSLHYATLGKLACRAAVVMTDHGQGRGSARLPSDGEWGRTDAVVAVSDAVAQRRQIPALDGKLSVIRNGVEPARARRSRDAVRAELRLREDAFVAIIVARIDGLKGHETLLRALAHLRDDGVAAPHTVLLVAGDGARRAAMEALAGELGLGEDRVRFLGFRSDAPDLLAAADLFILPSLAEGLPLSVLEAMAHRLPVVATPVGGVPEVVVPGETGLLVPTEDAEALAAAIAALIRDDERRRAFGAAGYERVLAQFSFEQMVARYDALYCNLRRDAKAVTP